MNREEIQEKIYRINCLTEETDSIYHQAAVQFGLSDSSLLIFYMLYTNKGQCRLSDLYMVSGTSKQTVNSAIRKMEKKELLYLTPGSGRNTQVFLTEKGKKLMEDTVYRVIEIENEIYNGWTPEERELFMKLNRDFAEKLSDKVKKLPAL